MHVLQCFDLCSSSVMAANLPLALLTGSILLLLCRIPFCVPQINVCIGEDGFVGLSLLPLKIFS